MSAVAICSECQHAFNPFFSDDSEYECPRCGHDNEPKSLKINCAECGREFQTDRPEHNLCPACDKLDALDIAFCEMLALAKEADRREEIEEWDEEADPGLYCDQCSKPQYDDGSGLCSWRAGTEFGSCDGRQHERPGHHERN